MRRELIPLVLAVVALVAAGPADRESGAQVLARPERAETPARAPARTQDTLVLTSDLLGGYGSDIQRYGLASQNGLQSGYNGYGDARILYQRLRAHSEIEVSGRGYGTLFGVANLQPFWGGDAQTRAKKDLGARNSVQGWLRFTSDPFVRLDPFAGLTPGEAAAAVPGASPTQAVYFSRAWTLTASGQLQHKWGRRSSSNVNYSLSRRRYPGRAGQLGFDSDTQTASADYYRQTGRSLGLTVSYRYFDTSTVLDPTGVLPIQQHTVDAGFRYDKGLSPTRRIAFSAGAALTRARTIALVSRADLTNWLPGGYARANVDLGRTWTVQADYHRALIVPNSVSPEPYVTDTVVTAIAGQITDRLDVALSGSYAIGHARPGTGAGARGAYENAAVTGQVRYTVSAWCAAVANFTHYQYVLRHVAGLPTPLLGRIRRDSVQAGLTFWIPLHRSRLPRPVVDLPRKTGS